MNTGLFKVAWNLVLDFLVPMFNTIYQEVLFFCIRLHFISAAVFFGGTTVILFEIYFCSSLPEQIVVESF